MKEDDLELQGQVKVGGSKVKVEACLISCRPLSGPPWLPG
jgi:hypothetical protein